MPGEDFRPEPLRLHPLALEPALWQTFNPFLSKLWPLAERTEGVVHIPLGCWEKPPEREAFRSAEDRTFQTGTVQLLTLSSRIPER